jgi:hypothetical protein
MSVVNIYPIKIVLLVRNALEFHFKLRFGPLSKRGIRAVHIYCLCKALH